ncbi:MAG TPA: phage holin family protein [Candidatus Binatia bacterium]
MYSGRPYASEPGLGDLVRGILDDAKELVVQGMALTKLEVQDELRKAKVAALAVGIGIGVIAVGGMLLLLMVVHLLATFTAVPLWGCYGIVGGALIIVGAISLAAGKRTIT